MAKAVFTARPSSRYDDLVEVRYHFPATYLRCVEKALGDWIVYYEPRRNGGRQAYFATASVERIEADPNQREHYYAYVRDYLDFDMPVPWRTGGGRVFEYGLQKSDGTTNKGAFGRSVRSLNEFEFESILAEGFDISQLGEDAFYAGRAQHPRVVDVVAESPRRIVSQLVSRPFRNEAFRHAVRRAYGNTCAFTGLSILNGGGRPEVQAAHIRAVEDDGPDSIRNGVALSGTVHWMFDRGLIAIGDDYEVLVRHEKLPARLAGLIDHGKTMLLPRGAEDYPQLEFVRFHRRTRFEKSAD
jgi:putative restriction endonuclease